MTNIAILLASYNGEKYIAQQLDSILGQSLTEWSLYISDDGSEDQTPCIVKNYITMNPQHNIKLMKGPRNGFAANFVNLLTEVKADYFFYCDQDDIWLPDKLQVYLDELPSPSVPALIGARTTTIDELGNEIGVSPLFKREPSFVNALVQSISGGNTMAMTRAARDIILQATERPRRLVSHDWWFYLILSGAEAMIIYDPTPSILYRQHADNVIGENTSFRARFYRLKMLMAGRFTEWSDVNIENLNRCRALLTEDNRAKLDYFIEARESGLIRRIWLMRKSGVYRQTTMGNIALWIAIILNKI